MQIFPIVHSPLPVFVHQHVVWRGLRGVVVVCVLSNHTFLAGIGKAGMGFGRRQVAEGAVGSLTAGLRETL